MSFGKKIIVCPLDWGLGHATRCIPVIRELQRQGAHVLIASSGNALHLLKLEFPDLQFFELPAYRPVYSTKISMAFKMLAQMPGFMRVVSAERLAIEHLVKAHKIDVVISDNRYGCWSSDAKSVLITHQLSLLMPWGWSWVGPFVNSFTRQYMLKFDQIWIPDQPNSGLTTRFVPNTINNLLYIGWLSRFGTVNSVEKKYEIIALVSGPEPQRRMFEKNLTNQLMRSGLKSLLVAGEPETPYRRQQGCLEVVNHLSSSELQESILASETVISRSGYSTVMDLIALKKKVVFVPTPQQTEQIFFAEYLKENEIAFAVRQSEFLLEEALERSKKYKGMGTFNMENGYLARAIEKILS